MAPLLVANQTADARAAGIRLCPPDALSALGPLLCLHGAGDAHLLSGWTRAQRLMAQVRLDSDGPSEALHFYDEAGHCSWRLYLLPDSDFHAWERLLSRLPVEAGPPSGWRRFWSRERRVAPQWHACAVRLHAIADAQGGVRLAATDVDLSRLGQACARRIAHQAGALGFTTETRLPEPHWAH